MIVREKGQHFICIKQNDHALIAGRFAANLKQIIEPYDSTLYAITHHDMGWEPLDQQIRWNEELHQPYSFIDFPYRPKIEAYRHGIAKLEKYYLYSGYLVSMYFASFFQGTTDYEGQKFYGEELQRQDFIQKQMSEIENKNIDANFQLLQFCDNLSLAICLNEPMQNTHPWFKDGILYRNQEFQWIWEDKKQIRLEPNPFAHSFHIQVPYQVVDHARNLIGADLYEWQIVNV